MHRWSVVDCYTYIEETHTLSFDTHASLFHFSDIKKAKEFLEFLRRNSVSVLRLELNQLGSLDSNVESFIYQIADYFAQKSQRSLSLQVDGESNLQISLTKHLLLLNQQINVSFNQ